MKAQELRIGNLVQFYSKKRGAWKLDKVHSDYFKPKELSNVKPIPLTEEWLERLGFNDGSDLQITENIYLIAMSDNSVRLAESGNFIGVNIQYVHQLQNLYFALTQKELTI